VLVSPVVDVMTALVVVEFDSDDRVSVDSSPLVLAATVVYGVGRATSSSSDVHETKTTTTAASTTRELRLGRTMSV
jgi:hypothetical protein